MCARKKFSSEKVSISTLNVAFYPALDINNFVTFVALPDHNREHVTEPNVNNSCSIQKCLP
jgi:hypothetical protein